ncbi:MAG TPA: FAD-dependent thymidylate synthase [Solirubrobacterales bacterium]|nr:FAD-dependent thymidylate synthase [Solirubrobacterales bacterium]
MAFEAKVLADSLSPAGYRLTTLEATFPRFVLAEFNTHRVFSRNSASSRAIPIAKQLRRVLEEPYVPIEFGSNQPGMQAGPALSGEKRDAAEHEWLCARDDAVRRVLGLVSDPDAFSADENLLEILQQVEGVIRDRAQPSEWLNVHKQVANRLLEPFMWHTVIVTATEWDNFWNLRCHPDAQPEIRLIAEKMREAMEASTPAALEQGEWHLPLVRPQDRDQVASTEDLVKVSVGRCARISYLTHAGKRDLGADIELHDRLLESGHMSPLEHPARPLSAAELEQSEWSGNFRGWHSYRKSISGEANPLGPTVPERAEDDAPAMIPLDLAAVGQSQ